MTQTGLYQLVQPDFKDRGIQPGSGLPISANPILHIKNPAPFRIEFPWVSILTPKETSRFMPGCQRRHPRFCAENPGLTTFSDPIVMGKCTSGNVAGSALCSLSWEPSGNVAERFPRKRTGYGQRTGKHRKNVHFCGSQGIPLSPMPPAGGWFSRPWTAERSAIEKGKQYASPAHRTHAGAV